MDDPDVLVNAHEVRENAGLFTLRTQYHGLDGPIVLDAIEGRYLRLRLPFLLVAVT